MTASSRSGRLVPPGQQHGEAQYPSVGVDMADIRQGEPGGVGDFFMSVEQGAHLVGGMAHYGAAQAITQLGGGAEVAAVGAQHQKFAPGRSGHLVAGVGVSHIGRYQPGAAGVMGLELGEPAGHRHAQEDLTLGVRGQMVGHGGQVRCQGQAHRGFGAAQVGDAVQDTIKPGEIERYVPGVIHWGIDTHHLWAINSPVGASALGGDKGGGGVVDDARCQESTTEAHLGG
jgi:hypothetical protein